MSLDLRKYSTQWILQKWSMLGGKHYKAGNAWHVMPENIPFEVMEDFLFQLDLKLVITTSTSRSFTLFDSSSDGITYQLSVQSHLEWIGAEYRELPVHFILGIGSHFSRHPEKDFQVQENLFPMFLRSEQRKIESMDTEYLHRLYLLFNFMQHFDCKNIIRNEDEYTIINNLWTDYLIENWPYQKYNEIVQEIQKRSGL